MKDVKTSTHTWTFMSKTYNTVPALGAAWCAAAPATLPAGRALVYLGHLQMVHVAPQAINDDGRRRQVEVVFDLLVAGELPATGGCGQAPFVSRACNTAT